jgi:DeoR/GlpR family transcriptional regulator of sugar metabolism
MLLSFPVKFSKKHCIKRTLMVIFNHNLSISITFRGFMIYFERQEKILALIKQRECVTVEFLCEHIFASPSTIRRDIAQMCEKKLIMRVRGGAAVLEGTNQETPTMLRFARNVEKKKKIAEIAKRYVHNANTLFLDSSSTVAFLARDLGEFQNLTIVTNGIQALNILGEKTATKLYACGGLIIGNSAITGSEAIQTINNFRPDIVFLSCMGFSLEGGVTDALLENAAIKRAMIKNARKRILLCDSTKLNQDYFCKVCDHDEVDLLITDSEPPEDILRDLRYRLVYQ